MSSCVVGAFSLQLNPFTEHVPCLYIYRGSTYLSRLVTRNLTEDRVDPLLKTSIREIL